MVNWDTLLKALGLYAIFGIIVGAVLYLFFIFIGYLLHLGWNLLP